MSVPGQNDQANVAATQQPSDKELNFRKQEQMFQRQLEQERLARQQAEEKAARLEQERLAMQRPQQDDDDEQGDEPYVDYKKLNKKLQRFGEQTKKQTQSEIQQAVNAALAEERRQNWLKANKDFQEVMQHAEKLYQQDQELAETILEMPEGFERQKLVYKNIKALGLHKPPEAAKASIQDKIDQNKRSPYYQPSGVGTAPYQGGGDFSPAGQKSAYSKLQELKSRLRI